LLGKNLGLIHFNPFGLFCLLFLIIISACAGEKEEQSIGLKVYEVDLEAELTFLFCSFRYNPALVKQLV
jgi:hypothetical protein